MLLQSHNNEIALLPALPKEWRQGSVRGLCARGGYEVSIEWKDNRLVCAQVTADNDNETAVSYNGESMVVRLKKGVATNITFTDNKNY